MKNFVCPASLKKCPSEKSQNNVFIESKDSEIVREYVWMQTLPTLEAYDWNCKYSIKVKRDMVNNADSALNGFM